MRSELLKLGIFSIAILSLPFVVGNSYFLNILLFVGINTILAVALNLLLGFAGQISLGHAAFFGLGAYISAVASIRFPISPWVVMIAAAVIVGVGAFLLGYPILKLKGHYLAMATLGFGIIIYIIFNETVDWTGGPSGLPGIPALSLGGFRFDNDYRNFYLIWSIALAVILLAMNVSNSRIGRALRAIHDSEVAARVLGVNARLLKVQIFALSAAISAIAGSLYAHTVTFISPTSFNFTFSVELVTMVIIGGLGTIYGPILGAVLLTLLPEFLRAAKDYDIVLYGALLIIITQFMPGGLIRGIPDLVTRMISKKEAERAGDAYP